MRVGGIIDISTKDIPNKSTMVVFTVGCNLNCSFCHNKYLLHESVGREMGVSELLEQIKSNMLVSGVSISGGEPTLQKDLLKLCEEIKKIGKYISIDTNGTNPIMISKLLPYINRIALDLKGPLNKKRLRKITGSLMDADPIIETFNLVNKREDIDFEVRTTYVENLMKPSDIDKIISFLRKNEFTGNFVLQQYQYSDLNLTFQIYLRDDIIGYCIIDKLYDYLDE
jgi:pyruvate formate lyase activating enzyme